MPNASSVFVTGASRLRSSYIYRHGVNRRYSSSMTWLKFFISAGVTLLSFGLVKIITFVYTQWTSPLKDLPGPKSKSLLYGNFKEIWQADNSVLQEQWVEEYGPTLTYKGFFSINRLFTMDPKALNHVLMNSDDYGKPAPARYNLSRILGDGVLVVEGEKHRLQRKIMNPAFGLGQIRELTAIFVTKSNQLRDIWLAELVKEGREQTRIDVLSWLSRATLDIIGLAGFNYEFDALGKDGKTNELNQAFSVIFRAGMQFTPLPFLQAYIPIVRLLPLTKRDRLIMQARATMSRIGKNLIHDAKSAINPSAKGDVGKGDTLRRDLLSLLIRANTATDLPESQRLSDEDVMAQVPTFLVAGHETTSNATTWALYALSKDTAIQTKLRLELLKIPTDNPTMDELNALPYLDAVVRETMRVHAPVSSTLRVALKDDVIPLSTPFLDRKGVLRDCIRLRKGDTLFIPILAMNRSKSLWGEDAMEFRPERWEAIPDVVSNIPGVWSNLLSFLGGPRACIGYRFALMEMKALLFALVREFEFELAVSAKDIVKKSALVQRPVVLSEPEGGNQMPLLVRSYRRP